MRLFYFNVPDLNAFVQQYGISLGILLWVLLGLALLLKQEIPEQLKFWRGRKVDEQEHRQKIEVEQRHIDQQARLQHLNSSAYASQMLTQALSESQVEGHDANEWIRNTLAGLLRISIDAQNARDEKMKDLTNAIFRTLLDLGDNQAQIIKAMQHLVEIQEGDDKQ